MMETKDLQRCLAPPPPDNGFDVKELLDEILLAENDKSWSRRTKVYHPSALSGCKRALYYDRMGEEPKQCIPVNLRMLFDLGHAIHDKVQARLKRHKGTNFEDEIRAVYEHLSITGRCDGIFVEEDWILEIKTIGEASYRTLVRPKKDHIQQAHCYMAAYDIPRTQILYINRNGGARRNFKITFSKKVWQDINDIISFVEGYVEKQDPPPQEISSYTCNTCKYKHVCKPVFD